MKSKVYFLLITNQFYLDGEPISRAKAMKYWFGMTMNWGKSSFLEAKRMEETGVYSHLNPNRY